MKKTYQVILALGILILISGSVPIEYTNTSYSADRFSTYGFSYVDLDLTEGIIVNGPVSYPTDSGNVLTMCLVEGYDTNTDDDMSWECSWAWEVDGPRTVTFKLQKWGDNTGDSRLYGKGILIDTDYFNQVDGLIFSIGKDVAMLGDWACDLSNWDCSWCPDFSGIPVVMVTRYAPNGDKDFGYQIYQKPDGCFSFNSWDGNDGSVVNGFIQVLSPASDQVRLFRDVLFFDQEDFQNEETQRFVFGGFPFGTKKITAGALSVNSLTTYYPGGDDDFAVWTTIAPSRYDYWIEAQLKYGNDDSLGGIESYVFQSGGF